MGILGMAASYLLFSVLHFVQFVLAVTVCGLYGIDLARARSQGKYIDGKWVCQIVPARPRPRDKLMLGSLLRTFEVGKADRSTTIL